MNKFAVYTILLSAGCCILTGCSSLSGFMTAKEKNTAAPTTSTSAQRPRHNGQETRKAFEHEQTRLSEKVLAGKWTIHSVNGNNVAGDDTQWPYIEFDVKSNKFYASNGCNILNGDFTVETGQRMSMSNILASTQHCAESEYPEINSALPNVHAYSLEEQNKEYYLYLYNNKNLTLMVLRKHNMDYLNGPWLVSEINGQKCHDTNVRLVIDIPEGIIHGNTGCNILNGSLAEDPVKTHSIQFHNIVTTRTACADVESAATEMALLIALEDVEYAQTGSHGSVKLLDKRLNTLIRLTPPASEK